MRFLGSWLAAVVLLPALAGCMGDDAPDAPAAVGAKDDDLLANVSVDNGTVPMSVEAGMQPHIHDYWLNRERVTLMDEDVKIDALQSMPFTFFNFFRGARGVGGALIELPDGAIVYEGTGQLDFTASWTEPTVTGLGMRYASAASTTFSDPVALTSGTPVTIEVTPEMTDMPHASTSRWQFRLHPGADGQSTVGTIHVKIEVVRMRDVTKFPGHPQLFNGAHTMTLFSGSGSSSQSNFVTQSVAFATGAQNVDDTILSEKVVPMETLTMTANLTVDSVSTNVGKASQIYLFYKPADSRRFYRANVVSGSLAEGQVQFAFPVSMSQTDSPYAKESQWRFDVRVATQGVTGTPCDRCADAKVDYQLEIVAYDSLLPEAGPDPVEQERGN